MPLHAELSTSPPDEEPTGWIDVSDDIRPAQRGGRVLTVEYGRDDETGQPDASTGRLMLDNTDRQHDPRTTTTRPWMHVRVWLDDPKIGEHDLFTGFVEGWGQPHDAPLSRRVEARLVDGLWWFARREVTLTRPAESSGDRVNAALDAIGWPAARRRVDPGVVTVLATDDTDRGRAFLDEAAEAEDGVLFVDPHGDVVFHDRHARLDLDNTRTLQTRDYREMAGSWDDNFLVNVAVAQMSDGQRPREHRDQASVDTYGERVHETRDMHASPQEAEALGQWAVVRYAETRERVDEIELDALSIAGGYSEVYTEVYPGASPLVIEPGWRVDLQRPWPDGTSDTLPLVVEGVTIEAQPARMALTWNLSPYFGEGPWARCDDGSLLDDGEKVAP